MDELTLAAYQSDAARHSARFRAATPQDLYHLIQAYFHPGAPTADIGCGSGRDVAWLNSQGYPTTGYDGSSAMLEEARRSYSELPFAEASLPELSAVADERFGNLLSSATLMHVPKEHLGMAIHNLARILRLAGRLVLSYRSTTANGEREADGRLYTAIDSDQLVHLLEANQLKVLNLATTLDSHRPGINWTVVVAEKS